MKKTNAHEYGKQYEKVKRNILWTATTKHIDIETGEVLTQHKIQHEHYKHVTTAKDYAVNKQQTRGHIEYIKLYKRDPQISLQFTTNM